ncbi:hypothetical protein EVAR_33371_1 [Eumeta japonica]|uniref:Uncharacterized protein n=1 Tax=Eumeta variegata TaxID=151549 RepID=A0A4C1X039_EUMVA|nr:hypothetical protein EVAR_33371_1 [Eumeta japonica]
MEPKGRHRNSITEEYILVVFKLVRVVLKCTLTMNEFQGLMLEPEDGAGACSRVGAIELHFALIAATRRIIEGIAAKLEFVAGTYVIATVYFAGTRR